MVQQAMVRLFKNINIDLGGTWVTYGVGTQFNITDNLSVWGNVDRTTGFYQLHDERRYEIRFLIS